MTVLDNVMEVLSSLSEHGLLSVVWFAPGSLNRWYKKKLDSLFQATSPHASFFLRVQACPDTSCLTPARVPTSCTALVPQRDGRPIPKLFALDGVFVQEPRPSVFKAMATVSDACPEDTG